jgi:hypothetical protein
MSIIVNENNEITTLIIEERHGKDFKYEDFTPEQLAALQGADGEKGEKGDPFLYEDFTQAQKDAIFNTYLANFYSPSIIALNSRVVNEGATFGVKLHSVQTTLGNDNPDFAFIPSAYKAGKAYSVLPSDGTGDFTVNRNSTASYIAKDGTIQFAQANEPRFDWSSGEPALLVEPQRTNLFTYSENFNQWVQSAATITFNDIEAPDGTFSGTKYENTTNSREILLINQQENVANKTYTFSLFAKPNTLNNISLKIRRGDNSDAKNMVLPINSGEEIINGWFKLEITHTFSGIASNDVICLIGADYNKAGSMWIWGAQLEEGSTATSYIKTEGSTKTRLKDIITVAPPEGTTQIIETIDGVEQNPITTIPATYQIPEGNINQIKML